MGAAHGGPGVHCGSCAGKRATLERHLVIEHNTCGDHEVHKGTSASSPSAGPVCCCGSSCGALSGASCHVIQLAEATGRPCEGGPCACDGALAGPRPPRRFGLPQGLGLDELPRGIGDRATPAMVREFAACLRMGASLSLQLQGVGVLPAEVSLDQQAMNLELVFNGVMRQVPLKHVRRVAVEDEAYEPANAQQPRPVRVQLDLDRGRSCIFVFDGSTTGSHEAAYFASCLRTLGGAARHRAAMTREASASPKPRNAAGALVASADSSSKVYAPVVGVWPESKSESWPVNLLRKA